MPVRAARTLAQWIGQERRRLLSKGGPPKLKQVNENRAEQLGAAELSLRAAIMDHELAQDNDTQEEAHE